MQLSMIVTKMAMTYYHHLDVALMDVDAAASVVDDEEGLLVDELPVLLG